MVYNDLFSEGEHDHPAEFVAKHKLDKVGPCPYTKPMVELSPEEAEKFKNEVFDYITVRVLGLFYSVFRWK